MHLIFTMSRACAIAALTLLLVDCGRTERQSQATDPNSGKAAASADAAAADADAAAATAEANAASVEAAPTFVGSEAVKYYANDTAAAAFLGLTVSCQVGSVTMMDFLNIRGDPRQTGLRMTYRLETDYSHEKPVVQLMEHTTMKDGKALRGYPEDITYAYIQDWPFVRFVGSEPAGTERWEPLSFFQTSVAPCNTMMNRRYAAKSSADGPTAPTSDAPTRGAAGGTVSPAIPSIDGAQRPATDTLDTVPAMPDTQEHSEGDRQ